MAHAILYRNIKKFKFYCYYKKDDPRILHTYSYDNHNPCKNIHACLSVQTKKKTEKGRDTIPTKKKRKKMRQLVIVSHSAWAINKFCWPKVPTKRPTRPTLSETNEHHNTFICIVNKCFLVDLNVWVCVFILGFVFIFIIVNAHVVLLLMLLLLFLLQCEQRRSALH